MINGLGLSANIMWRLFVVTTKCVIGVIVVVAAAVRVVVGLAYR